MNLLGSNNIKKLSDEEIIISYRRTGKIRFFNEIYRRYYHLVYGVCLNFLKNENDAKEVLSNVFEKLYTQLRINEIEYFKTWLFSVAKNFCLMYLRSKGREQKRIEKFINDFPEMQNGYNDENENIFDENTLKLLPHAIEQLKPDQKICINLFYLQQKCYAEISEITSFDLKQVKSNIQNGKRNLRLLLTQPEKLRTVES
ncbi:MAG: sigma-70 family RNA polymerase sigma factor [Bacteroidales bacterium]|nr:sigma-70 family RNA polymerase sigma factor [Bacteroidales bacterium]